MISNAKNINREMLPCAKCKGIKPVTDFRRDNRRTYLSRDGRYYQCKKCTPRKTYQVLPDEHSFIVNNTKSCSICYEEKSLSAFGKNKHNQDTRNGHCKECAVDRNKHYKSKPQNKLIAKNYQRERKLGISAASFKALFDIQQGKCGICETEMQIESRYTVIDHDHHTGAIRGILCGKCNLGIGHLKDNIAILHNAIAYLESHESGSHDIADYFAIRSKKAAKAVFNGLKLIKTENNKE